MSNMLIAGKDFATVSEVSRWANQLTGSSVPGNDTIVVARILQFQVIPEGNSFSALVLAETERKQSMSSMVINLRKDLGREEKG